MGTKHLALKVFCCIESILLLVQSNINLADGLCNQWKEWSDVAEVAPGSAGAYVFNYVIYITLAVFMAGFAGLYVTALAPYASGSGIPEVCV